MRLLERRPSSDVPPEMKRSATSNRPEAKPLAELKRREANDPTELLRTGYLCRGGGLLLCVQLASAKAALPCKP